MLVIPAIEIRDGRSCRTVNCADVSIYSDDPAELALLWRRENAKTIHLYDFDGVYQGVTTNRAAVLSAVRAAQVPTELVARFADVEECASWLDDGVYRIFIHDLLLIDPVGVRALVERYGQSRVCAGAITRDGVVGTVWRQVSAMPLARFAERAESIGMCRIFFTDRDYEGVLRGPNLVALRGLAAATSLRITAAGGIATVAHLLGLQELESNGVDSVVIGRAFYENRFPCQELWRDIEIRRKKEGQEWTGISTAPMVRDPELRGGKERR